MTTFRRFCCNDLLRLGRTNIEPRIITPGIHFYMRCMANWPANCYVAYLPGGLITGYIFGSIEGTDIKCTGWVSLFCSSYPDDRKLLKKLGEMLEDSCDKIYSAYTMKIIGPADNTLFINAGQRMGYKMFSFRKKKGGSSDDLLEMRKPLPRLVARNQSRIDRD